MVLSSQEPQRRNVPLSPWRRKMHEVIFEADTPAGKLFDLVVLMAILASVAAVMLESVESIESRHGAVLRTLEWFLTLLFTVEYGARILSVGKPKAYVTSFLGLVDLMAILPTYASLFVEDAQYLLVIRAIRLLRVFRIFKLARYVGDGQILLLALRASRPKITVFVGGVLTLVLISGTLMYLVEGEESGFSSIPMAMYWGIVTLTTVGYGDIVPTTVIGRFLAGAIMIMGYGIIAVPTGIVTVELSNLRGGIAFSSQSCPQCSREGHMTDAVFCKYCSALLNEPESPNPAGKAPSSALKQS